MKKPVSNVDNGGAHTGNVTTTANGTTTVDGDSTVDSASTVDGDLTVDGTATVEDAELELPVSLVGESNSTHCCAC